MKARNIWNSKRHNYPIEEEYKAKIHNRRLANRKKKLNDILWEKKKIDAETKGDIENQTSSNQKGKILLLWNEKPIGFYMNHQRPPNLQKLRKNR